MTELEIPQPADVTTLPSSPAVATEVFVDCKGSSSPVCNPTSTPARPHQTGDGGRSINLEGANPDL